MRGSIVSVVGAAFALILSANQSYAGAAKAGSCTVPPNNTTIPNSCSVEVPSGTTQVDPPGNIFDPDTTFTSGLIDDFGSGTGNSTTFNEFLDFPGYSNDFNGNQSLENSVLEFDGTFMATGDDKFDVCFNQGSYVQLFVDGVSVPLTVDDTINSCFIDPLATDTLTGLTPGSLNNFVLDYYTGMGDPDPTGNSDPSGYELTFTINGPFADDSLPGGTVPEPASMSLFIGGLAATEWLRRRRKRV